MSLTLVDATGRPGDLHGAPGSGVGRSGRALDSTSAASQGGNGPLAVTVGNTDIDFSNGAVLTFTTGLTPVSTLRVNG